MHNRLLVALAVPLSIGCAGSTQRPDPFTGSGASTLRVEIQNDNFSDATVYFTQLGGPERRVGDVVGNGRRSFDVPLDFTGDVRFRIELLADGWCRMYPIVVSPGDVVGLQIVPNFPASANCESAGGA